MYILITLSQHLLFFGTWDYAISQKQSYNIFDSKWFAIKPCTNDDSPDCIVCWCEFHLFIYFYKGHSLGKHTSLEQGHVTASGYQKKKKPIRMIMDDNRLKEKWAEGDNKYFAKYKLWRKNNDVKFSIIYMFIIFVHQNFSLCNWKY